MVVAVECHNCGVVGAMAMMFSALVLVRMGAAALTAAKPEAARTIAELCFEVGSQKHAAACGTAQPPAGVPTRNE